MLTTEELKRYNRHIILSEIGKEGQEKLKNAKVLVVGAGGLGCPVLSYLTAAGVGTLGIVDFDRIDESNLQRQVLYTSDDVGKYKAATAAEKLTRQNPFTRFNVHLERLSPDNILDIFVHYDIVVDGTDNFPTRYLVNDACVMLGKALVFGSIFRFEGQVSVFNYMIEGRRGPTYRCLFPEPPAPGEVPNCSQIGVLGVLPGVIGTLQANETLKIILGVGEVLSGKMLIADLLGANFHVISFQANEENFHIKGFMDYEAFCGFPKEEKEVGGSLSPEELKVLLDEGQDIVLLDVREDFEREICRLDGLHIPMNRIPACVDVLPRDKKLVVYCHYGTRSASVINYLSSSHGFGNLYNLEGGIDAWAEEVEPEMERY